MNLLRGLSFFSQITHRLVSAPFMPGCRCVKGKIRSTLLQFPILGLGLTVLFYGMASAFADDPWKSLDARNVVHRIDVEAVARSIDNHLYFRLCATPLRTDVPADTIAHTDTMLRAGESMLASATEDAVSQAKKKVASQIGNGPNSDWDHLARLVLTRVIGHVLSGVYQANSGDFELANRSFIAARDQWDACGYEDLSVVDAQGESNKVFQAQMRYLFPVASDMGRLVHLPIALIADQKKDADALRISQRVRNVAAGNSETKFHDIELTCWRFRGELQYLVGRWDIDKMNKQYAQFRNPSEYLYKMLAAAYRRLDELDRSVGDEPIACSALPRSFDAWRLDSNRNLLIDKSEVQRFRRAFEAEFPRESVRAIRNRLRELDALERSGQLSPMAIIEASKTNFGPKQEPERALYYEFRMPKSGEEPTPEPEEQFALERQINSLDFGAGLGPVADGPTSPTTPPSQ